VSQDLINRLYRAFSARDHETMARCYASDARFSDPVFTDLRGPEVAVMWRMLCRRATDLKIEFTDARASGASGSAHWEAWYTYTATGRPVHNVIDATFTFRDGLIATHRDDFGLYRWARQALGPTGLLLGWTPFVQRTIRRKAKEALASLARVSAA
jgi:ketosteroid isomerase-like protein